MRRALLLLAFLAPGCAARAPDAGTEETDVKTPPTERPLGGWGPLQASMERMTKDAEAIIDRYRATSGDAEARFALASMEIHFAMRDEFGPANAALFNARDRKLAELAGAVGLTRAPDPVGFAIDDFVRETRSFAQQIRAAGFIVAESPVTAGRLLWSPREAVGWELVVRDPTRTVEEDLPYSGTPHGPVKPGTPVMVNPSIRLYAFPHVRMTATQSMVRREQPGEPIAAGAASVLFRLQAAQSHDQDPGNAIGGAVLGALFRESKTRELPAAAKTLKGGTAVLERGLLRVSGRTEPPAQVPDLGDPEVRLVLWTVQEGADLDHALLPLR